MIRYTKNIVKWSTRRFSRDRNHFTGAFYRGGSYKDPKNWPLVL